MAHDWHRKWTQQDEANHTMPEEDFYQSATAGIPVSYGYNEVPEENQSANSSSDIGVNADHHHATNDILICLEREEGAKNPSLEGSHEDERKISSSQTINRTPKRHHSAAYSRQSQLQGFHESKSDYNNKKIVMVSSTEDSTSMDSSSHDNPNCRQVKRRFTGFEDNTVPIDDDQYDDGERSYESHHDDDIYDEPCYNKMASIIQRPLPIRPVVVKPVAIHANRPDCAIPQPTNARFSPFMQGDRNGRFPRDIVTNEFNGVEIVSPMSYSQLTGSSTMSSRSPLGSDMIGITVLKTDQESLHLVEDDCEVMPITEDHETDSISTIANNIEKDRDDVLHILAISDGDVESNDFKTKVDLLEKKFLRTELDTRMISKHDQTDGFLNSVSETSVATSIEGMWLTLSKPNFFGKLGENDNGDPMYTLGRMSFDMFSPTNVVCSLQGNFNRVEVVSGEDRKAMLDAVPKKLREEVESGKTVLRTYHVVTAFTIEPSMAAFPNAPNKDVLRPIRGIMTTYGYSLPDPDTPNRHSIWFTGGRIEPNNDIPDVLSWKNFFTLHPPNHSFGEKAKLLAVKLLMGATIPEEVDPEDGSMNYVFTRPLGGHGMAYVDVIYMDKSLRIVRGHRGTTFVFSRVPDVKQHRPLS